MSQLVTGDAESLVFGDRGEAYGPPSKDFARTAGIWTALLIHKLAPGQILDARDVGLLLVGLKLSREANRPKRDNLVDLCGYALCLESLESPGGC